MARTGYTVGSMKGRRLAGGEVSLIRFGYLLGLDATPEPYKAKSVAWVADHVQISVGVSNTREVVFSITARKPEERAFVELEHVLVSYRGKEIPEQLMRLIKARATRRLGPARMDQIAEFLSSDPQLGEAGLATPLDVKGRPNNQLDTWGAVGAWADFFAGGEMARGQLDSIDPTKLFSFIQHCDNECLLVNPCGPAPLVSLVDFPWGNRVRTIGDKPVPRTGGNERPDGQPQVGEMMTTDLNEQDVIRGNPKKIRDILEAATSRPNPDNKIIFFSNTCVPTVTGEDVESVVREFQKTSEVPLLYLTVTPKAMTDVFRDLLVNRRKRSEQEAPPPPPRTVNLIGYASDKPGIEVDALLTHFGVQINTHLLPDLDVEGLEKLAHAGLSVFRPNQVWQNYYEQLQDGTRTPYITPTSPFGWGLTRKWIGDILGALGDTVDEAQWQAYAAPFAPEWERVKARAAGHRLGMIIRAEEIFYLSDPGQAWGIPLIETLQEAGFGLDIMLYVDDLANAKTLSDTITKLFTPGSPHEVHAFHTLEAMNGRLMQTKCEAVLTHHFFDWRLSATGKNRFALQHFEMGIPGAIRTVDRLVDICETTFYRKYQRFLQRTREGLRVPPTMPSAPPARTPAP